MDKIKVTTTIVVPEGRILSQSEIDAIQLIIDGGIVPPIEKPKCKAGPTPQSVKVIDENNIIVGWHGEGVTPLGWRVANLLGSVNGEGQVVPKVEDIGQLKLTLPYPLRSSPKYQIDLFGIDCDGSNTLVFDNPYYPEIPDVEECEGAPTPKDIAKKRDYVLLCNWHGIKVDELEYLVTDQASNFAGKGTIKPKNGQIELVLQDVLSKSKKLVVTLSGVSCKGSGTLVADNPFYGDNCCEAGLKIESVTLNNKDDE